MSYVVAAEVWFDPGEAGWYVVTLPSDMAFDVRARSAGSAKAPGSVPAQVTIGATSWLTSLFADTKRASYLLPLKAPARRREGIIAGDTVTLTISLTG
jgi:Domain of unknown function (DUF1905)